jgi:trimeric autotransporter adhesin
MRNNASTLPEIALVFVRFNHVAHSIVDANHCFGIGLAKLARFFLNSAHMKTTTPQLRNLMNRSPLRAFLLMPFVLGCFALSPQARAVCQEGCLTNNNTALGENALFRNAAGVDNTATGFAALHRNTAGSFNTATGSSALESNTTGDNNTAIGYLALFWNTTGSDNTASGFAALSYNTTGNNNTANGLLALYSNTTGNNNTGIGAGALEFNTTGINNTATGESALESNTTGESNTASGFNALFSNTSGSFNTSTGVVSLYSNTSGSSNTATGFRALYLNNGGDNTATGIFAMYNNTTGGENSALGVRALNNNTTGNGNTAVGTLALVNNTVGDNNIALGNLAGTQITAGSDNIEIGNRGLAADSRTIRIGRHGTQTATFIAGISGAIVPTGVAVIVDRSGHLGTTTSSARFKEAIRPMDKASEAILELQPVTFRYKKELDPEDIPQFGLVAEEVEKVNPDLVARDEQGKPYTVRYEAVNAMLLNEFLKEHRKVEGEAEINRQQQASIARLEAIVKEQALQIQKVTAQLAAKNADPRVVSSD